MDSYCSRIGKPGPGQSLGSLESMGALGSPRHRPKPARQNDGSRTMKPDRRFARRRRWLPSFCPCIVLPQPAPSLSAER
jgi:hypothetical protein